MRIVLTCLKQCNIMQLNIIASNSSQASKKTLIFFLSNTWKIILRETRSDKFQYARKRVYTGNGEISHSKENATGPWMFPVDSSMVMPNRDRRAFAQKSQGRTQRKPPCNRTIDSRNAYGYDQKKIIETPIMKHPAATHGLNRSPILAAFQKKPRNPVFCSRIAGNCIFT